MEPPNFNKNIKLILKTNYQGIYVLVINSKFPLELNDHAATCNGPYEEELVEEDCPICGRKYPPERLPVHAQECAQQMFD